MKSINTQNLSKFEFFVKLTVEHLNRLFNFNFFYVVTNFFREIKIHALFHACEQIKWNRTPNVTDAIAYEHTHVEDAVKFYQQSLKE